MRKQSGATLHAKHLLGIALVAALLLSGCATIKSFFGAKQEENEPAPTVTVQVGAAESGSIQRKVAADVEVVPARPGGHRAQGQLAGQKVLCRARK